VDKPTLVLDTETSRRLRVRAAAHGTTPQHLAAPLAQRARDAASAGVAVSERAAADPLRYEVATRFFMTPGSEQLSAQASRLINAHGRLRSAYGQEQAWAAARDEHGSAVREFEATVRAVMRRGRI